MLVYANFLTLNPSQGAREVVQQVALWISQARGTEIVVDRLLGGIKSLRLGEGATLRSVSTTEENGEQIYPFSWCVEYSHGQPGVPGRRWVTEVGLRQESEGNTVQCSVLLRTDAVSAKVNAPVLPTRPGIVTLLIERCRPIGSTPGLSIIRLDEHNTKAFEYEVERDGRKHPLVQLSCDQNGKYLVQPGRLQSVLTGLAQVIEIPHGVDTFKIEEELGRRYSAFGGAINIIFPYKKTDAGGFCRNIILVPEHLRQRAADGVPVDAEVLAAISHLTNLPNSWKHISFDQVSQAILRARLNKAALAAHGSADLAAYEELLSEAASQIQSSKTNLDELRQELENRTSIVETLRAENESLKWSLASVTQKPAQDAHADGELCERRQEVIAAIDKSQTLEQALLLAQSLFPDRLTFLESALDSARESQRSGFSAASKAFDLIITLATEYWETLDRGKGDVDARSAFGKNSYSAKEAETLSREGRRKRTFVYDGAEILMEKHLKIGVKDSAAETLRIHFEWVPTKKRIVVGHCGKHLPLY